MGKKLTGSTGSRLGLNAQVPKWPAGSSPAAKAAQKKITDSAKGRGLRAQGTVKRGK